MNAQTMIPHILRKDLKLLWKPALAVSVPYLLASVLYVWSYDQTISDAIAISIYIAAFYLLITVVHQDPIPGDRADWLTRPIPRWELLCAKLLFALVTIVGPMMLVDIAVALAAGFDFGDVFRATFGHAMTVSFGLVLPAMALAAITRNISQCLIAVSLVALAVALSFPMMPWFFRADALAWLEDAALLLIGFVAACIILALQYRRRMTRVSVAIALAACLCVAINARVPWKKAWGLQARLSAVRGDEFQVRFDSARPPFQLPKSVRLTPLNKIYLPIQIDGWRKHDHVLGNASLRLRLTDGTLVDSIADPRELQQSNTPYIPFEFSGAPLPTENVSAEVTIHVSSSRPLGSSSIPVNGKPQWLPHAGRCVATPLKSSVNVECSQVGDQAVIVHIYEGGVSRDHLRLTQNPLAPFFLRWSPSVFTRHSTTLNTFAPGFPSSAEPGPPPQFLELRPILIEGLIERKIEIPKLRPQDWVLR